MRLVASFSTNDWRFFSFAAAPLVYTACIVAPFMDQRMLLHHIMSLIPAAPYATGNRFIIVE